jgi:hypothetical protein
VLGSYLRTYALEARDPRVSPWQAWSVDRLRAREALLGAADELRTYPAMCSPTAVCTRGR